MDKSAHVSYRRRGHAIEITIRRGITSHEMDTLLGKLSAHRMGSMGSALFLIAGTRKKIGSLDRVNMQNLQTRIYKELDKRATVGLLVQDLHSKGLLHKGFSHSMTSKENARQMHNSVFAAARS
jgi:hypothetical protein